LPARAHDNKQTRHTPPQHSGVVTTIFCLLLLAATLPLTANAATRAEAWVSEARPFIHQSIIYTVRVYHGAVKELNPDSLNLPNVSLERLDGPPDTTRTIDRTHLYSDFHYSLTPMRPGLLHIPSLVIKVVPNEGTDRYGRITGGYGAEFSVRTGPVNLDVRPAAVAGQAWLPLYELQIRGNLGQTTDARVGEPLALSMTQQGWGGGGGVLPKLEGLLKSPDFKIYTEQSQVMTEIHDDGEYLIGLRHETFTVIPTREGQLSIPPIEVKWWDLQRGRMNSTRWNGLSVTVGPGNGSGAAEDAGGGREGDWPVWAIAMLVLLIAAGSFFMGWWISVGRPSLATLLNRGPLTRADAGENEGEAATDKTPGLEPVGKLRSWVDATGGRLMATTDFLLLVPMRRRMGERIRGMEPRWMALWRLRSRMSKTSDPKALEGLMQRYAALQLGLAETASLVEIGDTLQRLYPKLTGTTARELLQRLDAGLYGGQSDDPALQRCSRDLARVLRAMGVGCPPGSQKRERAKLPDLNPGR
jgi:hypothetical protein